MGISDIVRVNELIVGWALKVELCNSSSRYDINRYSEDIAKNLLNSLYDYKLENLNDVQNNYPAIDLGDKIRKIAFQVTSQFNPQNIKEKLERFAKKDASTYCNGIYFLILKGKKINYSARNKKDFKKAYDSFKPEKNILTLLDLEKKIEDDFYNNPVRFRKVKDFLEWVFADRGSERNAELIKRSEYPFKGTEVFQEWDADIFFGRKRVVEKLCDHLEENSFLAVVGDSGCGKSSVARAGIIPRLMQTDEVQLFTPGEHLDPIENLAFALHSCFPEKNKIPPEQLIERLMKNEKSLHYIAREILENSPKKRLSLVIDQFDELFISSIPEKKSEQFVLQLLQALDVHEGVVKVVITIGSDFVAKCSIYSDFYKLVTKNSFPLPSMTVAELTEVIVKPAQKANLEYDDGLVEKILEAVEGEPSELPSLSYTLLELYMNREGTKMTDESYTAMGGVEGALINRAELQYSKLNTEEKEVLRKMFVLRLIQPGEGTFDMRRRATWKELLAVGGDSQLAENLLNQWIDSHLLSRSLDELDNIPMVEVSHEAFIRKWNRIEQWMKADWEASRQIGFLRQNVFEWNRNNKQKGFLFDDAQLAQMKKFLDPYLKDLTYNETEFVTACMKLQEEKKEAEENARLKELNEEKRQKKITLFVSIGALCVSLVIILILTISLKVIRNEKNRADMEKMRADAKYREAISNRLALEANRILPTDNVKAIRIAEASYKINPGESSLSAQQTLCEAAYSSHKRPFCIKTFTFNDQILSADFSSNGNRIIAKSINNLAVWNLKGKSIAELNTYSNSFSNTMVSADGTKAISIFNNKNLVVLDLSDDNTPIKVSKTIRHEDDISNAFFSSNSNKIITISPKERANLFDARGNLIKHLDKHTSPIRKVFFSEHKGLIFTASEDGGAILWDKNGKFINYLTPNSTQIKKVLFSKDDKSIITFTVDGEARFWHDNGDPFKKLSQLLLGNVSDAAFSPHNNRMIAISQGSTIKIWNLEKKSFVTLIHGSAVLSMLFSPTEPEIFITSGQKTVKLWKLNGENGELLHELNHPNIVRGAHFSNDGTKVFTNTANKIRIWSLEGKVLTAYNGHTAISSPKDETLFILSERNARLVNPNIKLLEIIKLDMDIYFPSKAAISSKGTILISEGNKIKMWNLDGGPIDCFPLETTVEKAAFSKNGRNITIKLSGNLMKNWEMADNGNRIIQPNRVPYKEPDANDMYLSRDSDEITIVSKNRSIDLWNPRFRLKSFGYLNNTISDLQKIVLSPDLDDKKRVLLTISRQKPFDFWRPLWTLFAKLNKSKGSYSDAPLLTEVATETVKLWDLEGNLLAIINNHTNKVVTACFSPDGTKILTASQGNTPKIRDLQGNLLAELNEQTTNVFDAIFSPSSTRILTLPKDKPPKLWDLKGHLLAVLETNSDKMQIEQNESSQILSAAFLCDHNDDDNLEADWIVTVSKDGTVKKWATPEKIINWLKDAPIPQLSEKEKKRLGIN